MAVADPLDALALRPAAVDGDLVEPTLLALDRDDSLRRLKTFERLGRNVVSGVDLALLERRHHRVAVGEEPEDDLVDLGLGHPSSCRSPSAA